MEDVGIPSVINSLLRLIDVDDRMFVGGSRGRSEHIHFTHELPILLDWSYDETTLHVREEVSSGIAREVATSNVDFTTICQLQVCQIVMRVEHQIMTTRFIVSEAKDRLSSERQRNGSQLMLPILDGSLIHRTASYSC